MATSTSAPERILQRLDWQVIRRLDGLLQGDYRSLFHGNGVDFADLREYQYGDDVRYIDWNVTARMDTPYVREYVEDREITAWFLLDLSPSVDFGTADSERQKRTVLVDFVTTLARLLTRHGNRVGAVFYGSEVERTIPARGGRIQVLRLVNDLLRQPRLATRAVHRPDAAARGRPALDQAPLARLRHLGLHQRAGLGTAARTCSPSATRSWRSACSTGARSSCPTSAPLIMEDAETGEQLYVDTHDKGFRRRFREAAERREADAERGVPAGRGRRRLALDRRRPRPSDRPDGDAPPDGARN